MSTSIVLDLRERLMDVAYFLDMRDLACLNQICPLNPLMMRHLWEGSVLAALKRHPVRGANPKRFMERVKEHHALPKQHVRVLTALRRTIFAPEAWEPWITKTSFCSFRVLPYTKPYLEDTLYRKGWKVEMPCPAAVPLSIGAYRGQSFVVNITVTPEGQLDDNICMGVTCSDDNQSMLVQIAPFSGHCFITCSWQCRMMKASVLKPVKLVPTSLDIWIQVFESGAIRFVRQIDDNEPEDAGFLPSEGFPPWIYSYFACVYHWGQTSTAAATVSVKQASESPPIWLSERPTVEMDADWEFIDPELQ